MDTRGVWTDDRVRLLKQFYADGSLTNSQIARALGGELTANAVIGKAHRMGIRLARSRATTRRILSNRPRNQRRPRYSGPDQTPLQLAFTFVPMPRPGTKAPPSLRMGLLAVNRDTGALEANEELTRHCCRWPDEERHPDLGWQFCGHAVAPGSAYCPAHLTASRDPIPASQRRSMMLSGPPKYANMVAGPSRFMSSRILDPEAA